MLIMAFPQQTHSPTLTVAYGSGTKKTLEDLFFNTSTPLTYVKPRFNKADLVRSIRGKYRHTQLTSLEFIGQKHQEAFED